VGEPSEVTVQHARCVGGSRSGHSKANVECTVPCVYRLRMAEARSVAGYRRRAIPTILPPCEPASSGISQMAGRAVERGRSGLKTPTKCIWLKQSRSAGAAKYRPLPKAARSRFAPTARFRSVTPPSAPSSARFETYGSLRYHSRVHP